MNVPLQVGGWIVFGHEQHSPVTKGTINRKRGKDNRQVSIGRHDWHHGGSLNGGDVVLPNPSPIGAGNEKVNRTG